MCTGVTKELAIIKFSGSPKSQGFKKIKNIKIRKKIKKPTKSLIIKYGLKGDLSKFLFKPRGLEEPEECKKNKWIALNALIIKGRRKWKEKNRVRVAFLTENPPHNQKTTSLPINGIAEARLVITVAPQKDIWPQGKTYPRKAVPITKNKRITPTTQVSLKLKEPKYIPRAICR